MRPRDVDARPLDIRKAAPRAAYPSLGTQVSGAGGDVSSGTVVSSGPAVAGSVPAARRLVRETLLARGVPQLVESAELLVSELVSNVVLHVGGTVTVAVSVHSGDVLLEVSDDSLVVPQLRSYSRTSSTGRGVRLVQSLSAEHGVRVQEVGKTVWVRLDAASVERDQDRLVEAFADVDWLGELDAEPARRGGEPHAYASERHGAPRAQLLVLA